ncbi:hypothetical protein N752_22850 [Desulforamulus aquiferis]|nr:hypothetical protein N752_22850 [Desulforamulus aquiferis]
MGRWLKIYPRVYSSLSEYDHISRNDSKLLLFIPSLKGPSNWDGLRSMDRYWRLGTVIIGMVFLGEPREWLRLFFVAMIIVGIIGLKSTSGH